MNRHAGFALALLVCLSWQSVAANGQRGGDEAAGGTTSTNTRSNLVVSLDCREIA
jgi:hypothetical protein